MLTLIADDRLQLIFTGKRMNARFQYNIIFQNEYNLQKLTFKSIWANTKPEALSLAREYGIRFIDARVVEVSKVV